MNSREISEKHSNFMKATYVEYKIFNELKYGKSEEWYIKIYFDKVIQNNGKERISKVAREKDLLHTMTQI